MSHKPQNGDAPARDIDGMVETGQRLSELYGRYAPPVLPATGDLNDWPVFAGACLARSHYALQSTMVLRLRDVDAAVLTRVLYEHVVTFAWVAITPGEHLPRFRLRDLNERRKAASDLESFGQDLTRQRAILDRIERELAGVENAAPAVNQRALEADRYWASRLETFQPGRLGFRGLYPALYRNFSMNTHPSIPGLARFTTGEAGHVRIGIPTSLGEHGVTLAPLLFGMGLLIAAESLGWPPSREVFAAFEHAPTCPACGSRETIEIVYGEPPASLHEAAARGELVIGGCIFGPDSPSWHCCACQNDFGRLDEDELEVFKEQTE
jgi:hypothetical protein